MRMAIAAARGAWTPATSAVVPQAEAAAAAVDTLTREESAMEVAFAEVVGVLNAHEADAEACVALYEDTPRELEARCRARAAQLREAAAQLLHMPIKAVRLQVLTADERAQAERAQLVYRRVWLLHRSSVSHTAFIRLVIWDEMDWKWRCGVGENRWRKRHWERTRLFLSR